MSRDATNYALICQLRASWCSLDVCFSSATAADRAAGGPDAAAVVVPGRLRQVRKGAVGRRPRTWFRLTAEGRQAVAGHLAWLAQLEEAVSASARDVRQARSLAG